MKKLLVAYDGSPFAESALTDLGSAGLPDNLEVRVISVADVWLPTNPPESHNAIPETVPKAVLKARSQALDAVESRRVLAQRAADRLRALYPQWKIDVTVSGDSPARAIVRIADEWRADLITLGSHGRSVLQRFFLGSVSQKVAAEAHCSIRIVRPRRHSHHTRLRVLVALDGSEDSQRAIDIIASRIWRIPCEFRVISVVDPRLETSIAWTQNHVRSWLRPQDEGAHDWVYRLVETAAQKLHGAGLLVDTQIQNGDAKQSLVKVADTWEADCIFLGARGRQHGDTRTLGGVASAVTARADCSVEIIRARG